MRLLCILAAIALLGCEQHDGTTPTVFRTWSSENCYDRDDRPASCTLNFSGTIDAATYTSKILATKPGVIEATITCAVTMTGTATAGTMVINSCTSTNGVSHPLLNTPITYSVTRALLTFKATGGADDVWTAL